MKDFPRILLFFILNLSVWRDVVRKTSPLNFLNEALKNIPYGKDGKLMELTREGYNFYFVSRDGTEKVKLNGSRFFKLLDDSPNLKIVQTIFKSRKYYHDNKPESTVPIQKIKKKRRVKNPEGAVPAVA